MVAMVGMTRAPQSTRVAETGSERGAVSAGTRSEDRSERRRIQEKLCTEDIIFGVSISQYSR